MKIILTKHYKEPVGKNIADYIKQGRKLLLSLTVISSFLFATELHAQSVKVSGVVTDENSQPMPGFSIILKGTSTGAISDMNGRYEITAPSPSSILVFSFIGYQPQEVTVGNRSVINIRMIPEPINVGEVVVTALGITKEKKKLAYSVQDVVAPTMTTVPAGNMASALTGKVAGLRIANSPNLFDTPGIMLRGVAPKIVIDGVPVESATFWETSPDDIESINVLKGPAGAVLYGQMGQNGVIQITTKKAKEATKISFNSSTAFDLGLVAQPRFQKKYANGMKGKTGDNFSGTWGPEMDGRLELQWNSPRDENGDLVALPLIPRGKDNLKHLLETGAITTNNVAFETKSEKADFRTSISHMYQKGVFANTKLNSFTINMGGGVQLGKKVRVDANINYSKLNSPNYPSVGYSRNSPIYTAIMWMGANVDVRDMRDYWVPGMKGLQQRSYDVQPGQVGAIDYNNPYFVLYENLRGYHKDLMYGSTSLKYDVLDNLSITARTAINTQQRMRDQRTAYSTIYSLDGNYSMDQLNDMQSTSDLIVKYDFKAGPLDFNAMAGGQSRFWNERTFSATTDGLAVPGVYTLNNTKTPTKPVSDTRELAEYAAYAYLDVNWENYIMMNATIRNQFSSTIPTTGKNSYLYPSLQVATIVSDYINMPNVVSHLKLRGSYARVGSAFSPYYFSESLSAGQAWNDNLSYGTSSSIYSPNILPSFSTGYEVGAELRMFKNRLGFDFAYFYFIDGPQTYTQEISQGSAWTRLILNGREDLRKGWELTVNATPLHNPGGLSWDVILNLSRYRKYLHKLPEGQTKLGNFKVGDRLDAIYGSTMMYAPEGSEYAGQMIINKNGTVMQDNITQFLGYANNDYMIGLSNSFSYKNFTLNIAMDACTGGTIFSSYERYMWGGGRHLGIDDQERRNWYDGKMYVAKGVMVISGELKRDGEGNVISDTRVFKPNTNEATYFDYLNTYKGYAGPTGANMVDRSFLKLREVVLTYNFPKSMLRRTVFSNASVSIVSRNLLLLTKSGFMDPDMYTEGQTSDNIQTPSFRNVGFNINLTF